MASVARGNWLLGLAGVVRQRPQFRHARLRALYENVVAGTGGDDQGVGGVDLVHRVAVLGDDVELGARQRHFVEDVGPDVREMPQLGLAGPDPDPWVELSVDGACRGCTDLEFRGLDLVAHELEVLERDDVLCDPTERRGQIRVKTVDHDQARHAPGGLGGGERVRVRMVPVRPRLQALGEGVLVGERLPWLDLEEDVVRVADG